MLEGARRVARNTGLQVGGEVASRLAAMAFYVVMAREFGEGGFGDFMFAASVVMFIEIAGLGTDYIVTRDVARDARHVDRLFWNTNAIKLILGAAALSAALGVGYVGGFDGDVRAAIAILGVARLLEILAKTAHATLRGVEDMAPIATSLMVQRFSTAAVGIAAMLLGATLVPLSLIYLGGAVLAIAYLGVALARRGMHPRIELSRGQVRRLALRSLPLGLSTIFGAALARLDAVFLALLKDNVAVGLYSAGYRLYEAVIFVTWSFGLAALPAFSRLGPGTSPSLSRAFEMGCKVLALVLFPIGTLFALFPAPIVEIVYGHSYLDATSALRLLGAATALYGFFMLGVQVLASQDRRRVIAVAGGLVLVENAALNLVLIPPFSFDGAAAAMAVSVATFAVVVVVAALRTSGRISWLRVVLGPTAGCTGMAVAAAVVGTGLPGLLVGAAVYPVIVLSVERRVFPRDLSLLRRSVRRRRKEAEGGGGQTATV
jgi:O-antigen/teichoic acid export membrane protein